MKTVLARIEELTKQGKLFRDINRRLTEWGIPQAKVVDGVYDAILSQTYQLNGRGIRWDINCDFSNECPEFSLCWQSNVHDPTKGYLIGVRTADLATRGKPEIWHGWENGTPEEEKDPAIAMWAKQFMERYIAQEKWRDLDYVILLSALLDATRGEAWK